ncbi:hypothetical protein BDV25DRAFT_127610 [Aspergillus avenaceus]|uniref:Uncharacterized protein n=1 Tax=Aspergillus avenaceus TaxID=36643 RepID=A0A5N6U353_ASPAV|nr:hypothetical protein BDV25DRAFT_127610 [Aspergillus avenaceus]
MAEIKAYSTDLDMFRQVFSSPQRRNLLRTLHYEIDLPTYSKNRIFCLERRREHRANNESFTRGMRDLYDVIGSWGMHGIDLTLVASSPMDPGRRPPELEPGLMHERWSFDDNYLTLDEVSLPQTQSVEALRIANGARSMHPSAIGRIISSLPHLQRLALELNAPKAKRVEMQDEHRSCLAHALVSTSLSNLRTLNIYIEQGIPSNHNFQNRPYDPKYPNGDILNAAIRQLAENTHLTNLSLTGDWLVSPELFNGEKTFPYLEKVNIQGALITYDGRWYYTGNPTDIEASYENIRDDVDDGSDSDSNSSFNSKGGDPLPEGREALLNGHEPYHMWRTRPDPQMFDPLMKIMATAIPRMPSLQNFRFSMGTNSMFYHGIIFEYLKPRQHTEWFEYPRSLAEMDKIRCYVTCMPEARWDVPGDVFALWKEVVGDRGAVAVETFPM